MQIEGKKERAVIGELPMMAGDMEAQWWKSGEVAEGFGDAGAGQEKRKGGAEPLPSHPQLAHRGLGEGELESSSDRGGKGWRAGPARHKE